eukprot:CAMPEP_0172506632 /NCGR_PEP_ID=MMETSP1066-20121228/196809_1 /TAXON_ID=671091 /ORGANISM="Coscinodiscus wailesii, Strain CCMP2513" /LENGTH=237 /DNA_ID=CAMNT_0013283741 /DNA_START=74 /DNA_END=787 /DNA_ORIENTATION=-
MISRQFTHKLKTLHSFQRSLTSIPNPQTNPKFVDSRFAPPNFETESAVVYHSIISSDEAASLIMDIEPRMKRRRYEKGHWDAVIKGYKEIEFGGFDLLNGSLDAMSRIKKILAKEYGVMNWLPCHVIDLKEDGELTAHVDSVRFSGGIVAGLSLMSPSVMRLRPDATPLDDKSSDVDNGHVDLYLPPLSLYVLSGVSRYEYTHELLPTNSIFQESMSREFNVTRGRRISIIFRDAKE